MGLRTSAGTTGLVAGRQAGWARLPAVLAACLALSACTDSSDGAPEAFATPGADASGTLTVWLMEDGQPESVVATSREAFEKAYPEVELVVELQPWAGIQDRLASALDSSSSPDVVSIASPLTARFADEGLLADLSAVADELEVDAMLPGLAASGELGGARYGVPYQGGVHVVVYNEAHFKDAGVSKVPTTMAALQSAAAKLAEEHEDDEQYSAFYFPQRFWQGSLPFIWGAGGEIAEQPEDQAGRWQGTLDSEGSRAGLDVLAGLVEQYSRAPEAVDQAAAIAAFRAGDVGMMIESWWVPGLLDRGRLAGDVGAFAVPGASKDALAPVYISGADLAVAGRSGQKALAVQWIRLLTGEEVQTQLAKEHGVIPNREDAFAGHKGNAFLAVADRAALVARSTPVSPNWANVENSQVIPDMLVSIFSGTASLADATSEASQTLTTLLNE